MDHNQIALNFLAHALPVSTTILPDILVDALVNNHPGLATFPAKYPSQRDFHRLEAARAEVAKAAPSVHTLLET